MKHWQNPTKSKMLGNKRKWTESKN